MRDSVLIATPAYGGLLHSKYVTSLVGTCRDLASNNIKHGLYILPNESLVTRARNRCAAFALKQGFDKMMFIDSDLGWKAEDIAAILMSNKAVVGGTYPIKQADDPRLAYNPAEDLELPPGLRKRSYEELLHLREHCADPRSGELEVRHIPTGFMKIDCSVLKALQEHVPSYQQDDAEPNTWETHYDYFPVRLVDNIYESEDWAFCSLVREHLDCGVWLNTRVVLTHTGTYTYRAEADPAARQPTPRPATGLKQAPPQTGYTQVINLTPSLRGNN